MKKTLLFVLAFIYSQYFAQNKISLSHASQYDDFIEVGIEIDKPVSKFDLIDLETLTVTDPNNNTLKENWEYPLNYNYNNGITKVRRFYIPDKKIKTADIKGVFNYFTPSKETNTYFDLGTLKDIRRNVNLIDKKITNKNPYLHFSIVDSTEIKKIFPDFEYKEGDEKEYKKINFKDFDFIYAYRYNNKQKLVYFFNDNPDPGYHTFTLGDKNTRINYILIKLKHDITPSELDNVRIELMIENEKSVRKIPFELKNVTIEEK